MKMPQYIKVAQAAEITGYKPKYLKSLYHFPGQNFAIKLNPLKQNSTIMYDLDAFYKWIAKMNRKKGIAK